MGVKCTFGAKKMMLVIFFSAMASPLLKRMKKKQKKFVLQFSSLTLIDENAVLMHRNDLIYALKLRIHSEVLGLRFRTSAMLFFNFCLVIFDDFFIGKNLAQLVCAL